MLIYLILWKLYLRRQSLHIRVLKLKCLSIRILIRYLSTLQDFSDRISSFAVPKVIVEHPRHLIELPPASSSLPDGDLRARWQRECC
jgi:hypothetical protein